jgi:hypothetical protein
MIDYAAVLNAKYPGSQWSINDNDYDQLTWLSDTAKPTKAELDAAWPEVDYNNQIVAIQIARRTAYEQQSDGLFFEWQRGDNTETAWREAVAKVKATHPYPPAP